MPFTDTQKAEVRKYLGYPDLTRGEYSKLEGALVAISEEAVSQVTVLLADIASVETELRGSWSLQKAKKVEEITLAGSDQISALRSEGNRLVTAIGSILGVWPTRPYFTTGTSGGMAGRG